MLARCLSAVSVLVVFLVLAAGIALAQDNWLGGTGNWSDAANWVLGPPGPVTDVLIYSGGPDFVYLDISPTINSLGLGGASNGSTSELTDGGVAQSLAIFNALNIGQSGVLYLNGGSTVNAANATNAGTIQTGTGTYPSCGGSGGGNMITISGVLTNYSTGQMTACGAGDVVNAIGGLYNYGFEAAKNGAVFKPPFLNNGGTITIDSTSKFVVGMGNPAGLGYIQTATGTLGEIINSNASYGTITVSGSALLAGTLDILLKPGFNPTVGTEFTFLTANPGELSGTFASILNDDFNGGTEKWVVVYNNAGGYVELEAQPTPEPSSFLLLGSGLLGLGWSVRRRSRC